MRSRALLPFALLLTACSSELTASSADPASTGEAKAIRRVSQPIVNGVPDSDSNDEVLMINIGSQGEFCTGTLIAPNLVLTAHHCVATPDETQECGGFSAPTAPSQLTVSVGRVPGNPIANASRVFIDSAKPNTICGNDIGLFQLDRDITGVTIARVRLTPPVAGEVVTTSGYGDDGTGNVTNGRFVRTGIKVDAVGPSNYNYTTAAGQQLAVSLPAGEIGTGESTCFGDSGGPLFDAAGNVIGMTSRGIDGECNDRPSIYSDTASHAAAIQAAAAAAGHTLLPANPLPGATQPGTSAQSTSTGGDSTGTGSRNTTSTTSGDSADDGSGDPTDEPVVKTPTKHKTSLQPAASAGCSIARAGTRSSSSSSSTTFALFGVAIFAALRLRRSRPS